MSEAGQTNDAAEMKSLVVKANVFNDKIKQKGKVISDLEFAVEKLEVEIKALLTLVLKTF